MDVMDSIDMIAVVGPCSAERARHAEGLADITDRGLVTAAELGGGDSITHAIDVLRWQPTTVGTVVEFPIEVDVVDLIGTVTAGTDAVRLIGVVCVVDAVRLLDDLSRDDYAPAARTGGYSTAVALLVARQIEYASEVVLANWAPLSAPRLSTAIAIVGYLSPTARVHLNFDAPAASTTAAYGHEQVRPGWVQLINGDFIAPAADRRVRAVRYEHLRPLHPARAARLLDTVESGRLGRVVRSVGFCRLASRPGVVAQWDHVGCMLSLAPVAFDGDIGEDEEVLAIGQELAFIGIDLDADGLRALFDDAALTDSEMAAGPASWFECDDPFPPWPVVSEPGG